MDTRFEIWECPALAGKTRAVDNEPKIAKPGYHRQQGPVLSAINRNACFNIRDRVSTRHQNPKYYLDDQDNIQ